MTVTIKKWECGRTTTQMWNQTGLILSFSCYAVPMLETHRMFFYSWISKQDKVTAVIGIKKNSNLKTWLIQNN